MIDDAIRERHGCYCRANNVGATASHVMISERDEGILLNTESHFGAVLTQWQARYLAAKLYRLSRRLRDRTDDAA